MTVNDLSPGFVKIFYGIGTRAHTMTIPVIPDTIVVGSETLTTLETKGGTPTAFFTCINALIDVLQPTWNTAVDIPRAELWSKPTPASDPTFVCAYDIAENGTSSAATVLDGQAVWTHRTLAGGVHRLYVMEPQYVIDIRELAPFSAGSVRNVSDFLTDDDSWIVGRDGAFLTASIAFTTKKNDALRRKRLFD